jgi:protein-disulfide isomerase
VFDPTGSSSQYSGISINYPKELIYPEAGNDPYAGPDSAKVFFIEFGCFSCPYTKQAEPVILQLMEEYKDKEVKFIFKEFPLPKHSGAIEAGLAIQCATDYDKYFEARAFLFENNERIQTGVVYKDLAKTIGVNEEEFIACMNDQKTKDKLLLDVEEGVNAHIYGTPTVFINNETIVGPKDISEYRRAINRALK